jgi:3-oxoacyl-[acyl-carrier protein] reductase
MAGSSSGILAKEARFYFRKGFHLRAKTGMKDMFKKIKNKKVLITGSSSGIGAETAMLFSSFGANVGIHYCENKENAYKLLKEIKANTGKAAVFHGDLMRRKDRKSLIRDFIKTFGRIDVLINNAGAVIGGSHFLKLKEKEWEKNFSLNVEAPFFLARDAFSFMKTHGGGRIINISSIAAKYGGSSKSMHYGAAKAALDAITIGLSRQGAEYNILVNSIRPGVIDTPFHAKFNKRDFKERIKLIPLGRMGKALDIARLALFLASGAGGYITGEIITVGGGD